VAAAATPYGVLLILAWPLCDRFGGAIWTIVAGAGTTLSTVFTCFWLTPSSVDEFSRFLRRDAGDLPLRRHRRRLHVQADTDDLRPAPGWTGAMAAFGPFLFGMALASLAPTPFVIGLAVFFAGYVLAWHY